MIVLMNFLFLLHEDKPMQMAPRQQNALQGHHYGAAVSATHLFCTMFEIFCCKSPLVQSESFDWLMNFFFLLHEDRPMHLAPRQ